MRGMRTERGGSLFRGVPSQTTNTSFHTLQPPSFSCYAKIIWWVLLCNFHTMPFIIAVYHSYENKTSDWAGSMCWASKAQDWHASSQPQNYSLPAVIIHAIIHTVSFFRANSDCGIYTSLEIVCIEPNISIVSRQRVTSVNDKTSLNHRWRKQRAEKKHVREGQNSNKEGRKDLGDLKQKEPEPRKSCEQRWEREYSDVRKFFRLKHDDSQKSALSKKRFATCTAAGQRHKS